MYTLHKFYSRYNLWKLSKRDDLELEYGKNILLGRKCNFPNGKIVLGDDIKIGGQCRLRGNISISSRTNLVRNVDIFGNVNIGKYCAIARNVVFQGINHFINRPGIQRKFYDNLGLDLGSTKKPINIGNDVWIGRRAIILEDVTVGDGAVIGAGAVVTKDVEPYSISAGVPATHRKWRFRKEIKEQLLKIKWWDWDDKKILRNKEFFETDLSNINDLQNVIK